MERERVKRHFSSDIHSRTLSLLCVKERTRELVVWIDDEGTESASEDSPRVIPHPPSRPLCIAFVSRLGQ